MKILPALAILALSTAPLMAQDRPLVIPQVEGAKQGRIIGRAMACGLPQDRSAAVIGARRERMLAAVGPAFTEDRYLPALNDAIGLETGLPKPSDAVCEKALAAFEALEHAP